MKKSSEHYFVNRQGQRIRLRLSCDRPYDIGNVRISPDGAVSIFMSDGKPPTDGKFEVIEVLEW